jgi:hypothetical protein
MGNDGVYFPPSGRGRWEGVMICRDCGEPIIEDDENGDFYHHASDGLDEERDQNHDAVPAPEFCDQCGKPGAFCECDKDD